MRFAYADPPYLGCAARYADRHPNAMIWDDPKTHQGLIERLCEEFPDGWAMSLISPTLKTILPMCPDDCRIGAWVKPFCSYKPGVSVAYAWEPVIFRGGRKRPKYEGPGKGRDTWNVRDWVSSVITLKRNTPGAKPDAFCWWIFDLLGMKPEDEFVDLFPGSGAVGRAWNLYCRADRDCPLWA